MAPKFEAVAINGSAPTRCGISAFVYRSATARYSLKPDDSDGGLVLQVDEFETFHREGRVTAFTPSIWTDGLTVALWVADVVAKLIPKDLVSAGSKSIDPERAGYVFSVTAEEGLQYREAMARRVVADIEPLLPSLRDNVLEVRRMATLGMELAGTGNKELYYDFAVISGMSCLVEGNTDGVGRAFQFAAKRARPKSTEAEFRGAVQARLDGLRLTEQWVFSDAPSFERLFSPEELRVTLIPLTLNPAA